MKGKRRMLQMLTCGLLSAALLAGPAQAADPEIRVGSYKGNTLEAGERVGPWHSDAKRKARNDPHFLAKPKS